MEVRKAAALSAAEVVSAQQLEKINRLAKRPLSCDEVYVFSVRLCDDQIDRDCERFDTGALPELARLFVGKTGIMDHDWKCGRQTARIFDAAVEKTGAVSYVRAWAYLLRTEGNRELIAQIDGGIKKEVSVGCSMGKRACSVCGQAFGTCAHKLGEAYGGAICAAVLSEPRDAYEFSFVAVPAQKDAGVLKAWKGGEEVVLEPDLKALEQEAALGRAYLKQLRSDVVRLGLALDFGMDEPVLQAVAKRMDADELLRVKEAMGKKTAELFPGRTQLPGGSAVMGGCEDAFLI